MKLIFIATVLAAFASHLTAATNAHPYGMAGSAESTEGLHLWFHRYSYAIFDTSQISHFAPYVLIRRRSLHRALIVCSTLEAQYQQYREYPCLVLGRCWLAMYW
ncbi:hypothetical protein DAEQUDRAFT_526191 [Daedalea quercina L-15889]|uniref:Uncharacterized protein n=1 Tax=Daedalea quercina L-15889 TaxID=1314783 RepID=A0A165M969_9APHY|nr:hypothetical protein DAEQUDRAFT_526191 [Daedalea quercina L-15889]